LNRDKTRQVVLTVGNVVGIFGFLCFTDELLSGAFWGCPPEVSRRTRRTFGGLLRWNFLQAGCPSLRTVKYYAKMLNTAEFLILWAYAHEEGTVDHSWSERATSSHNQCRRFVWQYVKL